MSVNGPNLTPFPLQISVMSFGPRRSRCDPMFGPDIVFFATGHINGTILLWDTTGHLITKFLDHDRSVSGLVFTPRVTGMCQLISASLDGKLKVIFCSTSKYWIIE